MGKTGNLYVFFNKKKLTIFFLLLVVLSGIFIAKYFSKNDDFVSEGNGLYNVESTYVFPMLSDLKQGFSLNYWITSPAPFYFPDWILDGAAYVITGFSNPQLAKNISRIIFNLLIFLLMYFLSKKILYKKSDEEDYFVNFCLKVIYLSFFMFFLTQGGMDSFSFYLNPFAIFLDHAGTLFNTILCFYLFLVKNEKTGKLRFFWESLFFLLVFICSLSDILFITVFSVPLLIYALLKARFLKEKRNIFQDARSSIAILIASFLGFSIYGKIITRKISTSFDLIHVFKNFFAILSDFTKKFFGFLLFSGSISSRLLFLFSFLIFCFLILIVIFSLFKKKFNFYKFGFLLVILFSSLFNFFSGIFIGINYVHEERYFLEFIFFPLLFFPIFLLQYFKKYLKSVKFRKSILIFVLLFLLLFNINLIKNYFYVAISSSKLLNNTRTQIAQIIDGYKEKYHLESGISNYWLAKNITYHSQEKIFCFDLDPSVSGEDSKLLNIQKVFFENIKTLEKRKYNFILAWKDTNDISSGRTLQDVVDKYIEIFGSPNIIFEDKNINGLWGETKILVYDYDISEKLTNYLVSYDKYEEKEIWTQTITRFLKKVVRYPGDMNIYGGIVSDIKNKITSGVSMEGKQDDAMFGGESGLYPGEYVLKIDSETRGNPIIYIEISTLGRKETWDKRKILLSKQLDIFEKEFRFSTADAKLNDMTIINFHYKGERNLDFYKVDKLEMERVGDVNLFPIYLKYFFKEIIVFLLTAFLFLFLLKVDEKHEQKI